LKIDCANDDIVKDDMCQIGDADVCDMDEGHGEQDKKENREEFPETSLGFAVIRRVRSKVTSGPCIGLGFNDEEVKKLW